MNYFRNQYQSWFMSKMNAQKWYGEVLLCASLFFYNEVIENWLRGLQCLVSALESCTHKSLNQSIWSSHLQSLAYWTHCHRRIVQNEFKREFKTVCVMWRRSATCFTLWYTVKNHCGFTPSTLCTATYIVNLKKILRGELMLQSFLCWILKLFKYFKNSNRSYVTSK